MTVPETVVLPITPYPKGLAALCATRDYVTLNRSVVKTQGRNVENVTQGPNFVDAVQVGQRILAVDQHRNEPGISGAETIVDHVVTDHMFTVRGGVQPARPFQVHGDVRLQFG